MRENLEISPLLLQEDERLKLTEGHCKKYKSLDATSDLFCDFIAQNARKLGNIEEIFSQVSTTDVS